MTGPVFCSTGVLVMKSPFSLDSSDGGATAASSLGRTVASGREAWWSAGKRGPVFAGSLGLLGGALHVTIYHAHSCKHLTLSTGHVALGLLVGR